MSTSMASCSTCSSSLISSNCTSSSLKPTLHLSKSSENKQPFSYPITSYSLVLFKMLLFFFLVDECFCVMCECVWSTHSESGSVGHSWWLAAVQDSCLSCRLVSDSSSSSPRWCEAYGEAVCMNMHRQEIRQSREMKLVKATLCSFSALKLKIIFIIHWLVTGRNATPAIHTATQDGLIKDYIISVVCLAPSHENPFVRPPPITGQPTSVSVAQV